MYVSGAPGAGKTSLAIPWRATHAVHVIKRLDLAAMAEYDRPMGVGALIRVDTTRPVDAARVAKEVREHYPA